MYCLLYRLSYGYNPNTIHINIHFTYHIDYHVMLTLATTIYTLFNIQIIIWIPNANTIHNICISFNI
jgi:hypothetical protein